jgi:hypothetical protein
MMRAATNLREGGHRMANARDPVEDYQRALIDLHRCINEFDELRRLLQSTAVACMFGWQNVVVIGIDEAFPAHVIARESHRTIDASNWPTPEKIAKVLLAAHQAQEKALQAWDKIPDDHRAGLSQPPPR